MIVKNSLSFDKIKSMIVSAKNIAILGHRNPDMDCYGSMFGMHYACKKLRKNSTMFALEKEESYLKAIFPLDEVCHEQFKSEDFDLVILVDCNDIVRLEDEYKEEVAKQKNLIVIDHHQRTGDVKQYYIDTHACGASLVVKNFIQFLGFKLDKNISTYIMAGIVGDTDRFLNTNTNLDSFASTLELLKSGANLQLIYDVFYRSTTMVQINLYKFMLNHMKIFKNGASYILVDQKDLKKLGATVEDVKFYSNTFIKVRNINVAILAYESKKDDFKLSLRSKVGFNVYEIAKRYGGGGHICASGATLYGSKRQVEKELKKICEEF